VTGAEDTPPAPLCSREKLLEILARVAGRHVVLMGLGMFGGGEGAARFLAQRGAHVTVTDLKTADQLAPALQRLSGLPIRFRLGEHDVEEMTRAELIVVNPAVPKTSELLRACQAAGVPLTSPMNMFLALCRAPVVAVSGSTGKSTTTAMLFGMLQQGGRPVRLGGNIGICLLSCLDQIGPHELVVLELSSYHLEDAAHMQWSPHVALVTNLTPNHLDRYKTFDAYSEAKRNILLFQGPADAAVLNAADENLKRWVARGVRSRLLAFDPVSESGPLASGMNLRGGRLIWNHGPDQQVICTVDHIPVPGAHNVANAMAAAAAARWLGVPAEGIRQAIAAFEPLEHRLEQCGSFAGITFYNDSDSTTPESTMAALKSFSGPVTLIAGGLNKGLDMMALGEAIAQRVEVLITLGSSGPHIADQTRQAALAVGRVPVIRGVSSLEEAVAAAVELSVPGSVVVLSPACASFDMFQNYDERGRQFKELVAALSAEAPHPRRA